MRNLGEGSAVSNPISVRPRPSHRAWLEYYAKCENRSLSGALSDVIERAMKADPLRIVVRRCQLGGAQFYDVSVGVFGDAFHECKDKGEAIEVAHAKIRELGLPRSAIQFRVENDEGPAFGTVVTSQKDFV